MVVLYKMCLPDKDEDSEIIRVEMKDEIYIRSILTDNFLQKLNDINWNDNFTLEEYSLLHYAMQILNELNFIRANS